MPWPGEHFRQMLTIDPSSETAQRGLAAANYHLTTPDTAKAASDTPTILDRARQQERVQIEYIEASFASARDNINRLLLEHEFEQARSEVSQVLANIEGARQLLGARRYESMSNQARGMLSLIDQRQRQYQEQTLTSQIEKAQAEEVARQQKAQMARQKKIEELFQRALEYRQARQLDQAIATLQHLLTLAPQHEQAKWMLEDLEFMTMLIKQQEIQDSAYREESKVLAEAREASIPWSDIVTYGNRDAWLQLKEKRRPMDEEDDDTNPLKRDAMNKLDTVKVDLDYVETELRDIISDIGMESDLQILVSWNNLEAADINRDDLDHHPDASGPRGQCPGLSSSRKPPPAVTTSWAIRSTTTASSWSIPSRSWVPNTIITRTPTTWPT